MEFSPETLAALEVLDQFTSHKLRKREDVGTLLEIGVTASAAAEFNKLVFQSKVSWNVYNVLNKSSASEDAYPMLEREFGQSIADLREALVFFAANAPEVTGNHLKSTYLGMESGTLRNLIDLAHDLAQFKDLQADRRRQRDDTAD